MSKKCVTKHAYDTQCCPQSDVLFNNPTTVHREGIPYPPPGYRCWTSIGEHWLIIGSLLLNVQQVVSRLYSDREQIQYHTAIIYTWGKGSINRDNKLRKPLKKYGEIWSISGVTRPMFQHISVGSVVHFIHIFPMAMNGNIFIFYTVFLICIYS
jgi:hypothetical protein